MSIVRLRQRSFRWLLGLLFFVSGFTGLLYEVIWAKYLALLLGSTAYAQVGVLAVFMGGLAIGSIVWGRAADRSPRPLALYGVLEIGVGLCAAAFAYGFDEVGHIYWAVLGTLGNTGAAATAVKSSVCIMAMFPPTFCMGGTLPVITRALGLERASLGRGIAYLYAVNSLGAALGAVLTGFYLVATWGFDAPFIAAAAVNVAVGVVAVAAGLSMSTAPVASGEEPVPRASETDVRVNPEARDVRAYWTLILVAAAVCGAVAMTDEVAWIRLCGLILGSSTYSFSIMLTAFIIGIAAGSFVYTWADAGRLRPFRFFAYVTVTAAATLLLCLLLYDRLPFYASQMTAVLRQHDASFVLYQATMLLFCLAIMLPLTFASGLTFPALMQAAGQVRSGIGQPVSRVLFANTAGTILGAVGGGLYLLPHLGLRGTFVLGGVASAAMALVVLACDRSVARRHWLKVAGPSILGCVAYGIWAPGWDLRLLTAGEFRNHTGIKETSFAAYRDSLDQRVVFYQDGASATVSVERRPDDEVVLRVNGKADASAYGDRNTELLAGHLPAVLRPGARRALVIGYGSGMTVGALLQHAIESVDVVEISPEVIAADTEFRPYNHDPLHDRRTQLYTEDARTFLYRAQGQYDLIISEPSNPWIAGIGNLFTREFFEQARRRLAADGLLVQWFHTYETSDSVIRLILRTVGEGFGDVRVFQPIAGDMFVIASPVRRGVARPLMEREFVRASELGSLGINRLATLLALEVLPDAAVRQISGAGMLNLDRLPVLEYAAPRAFFDGKDARLLATADISDRSGFTQSADALSSDDYVDVCGYLQQAGLETSVHALPLMAAALAHAPSNPLVVRWLDTWLSAPPDSSRLVNALANAAADVVPTARVQYAQLLMHVVGMLHLRPQQPEIAAVAPVIESAALQSDAGATLLQQLGGLYAAAGAHAQALASFQAATARAAGTDGRVAPAESSCARTLALEGSPGPAAWAALQECLRSAPSNTAAPPRSGL